jgi:hypothetical protein
MISSRKAAIQAYKERPIPRGVFAVRCRATNRVWVDSALNLEAAENRIWFALRLGDVHMDKSIVAEFQAHGREAFHFEILEKIDDDVTPMALKDLLKEKKLLWMAQLGALTISPM